MGSASELEYHLILARDLRLLSQRTLRALAHGVTEVKRMLSGLITKLQQPANGRRPAEPQELKADG
ncbi:MAG: four helix bundle protein [Dehalococcoidia bacterium]